MVKISTKTERKKEKKKAKQIEFADTMISVFFPEVKQ
jgi:hypothetical protein